MYKIYMKNAMYLTAEVKLHWANIIMILVGSSQVWEMFSLMCFEFWLEISGEEKTYFFSSQNERIGNSCPERYRQNPRSFSRPRMIKQITPLESSCEI